MCRREVAGRWPETLARLSIQSRECKNKLIGIQGGDGPLALGGCEGEIVNGDGEKPYLFCQLIDGNVKKHIGIQRGDGPPALGAGSDIVNGDGKKFQLF